ncbi:glycosyltransferase family 4 protein [Alkalihalophilus pseudofirmus]|uniref:glycosyltransferase family 4 protein n=1 Tax=Alkalihalophilus pseudofirmus TaxID=79885 RepID=UPI00259BC0F7|nr:glycosyltransferase family 4 protein [Alkalihalophilus pseudofirmus]WEG15362.1 glycosyltransferase family 4 protein [Alkalihalophilus pseudofirmus]
MKKILLLADHPGWAWEHRARDLMSLQFKDLTFQLEFYNQLQVSKISQYDTIYAPSISMAKQLTKKGINPNKIASGLSSIRSANKFINGDGTIKKSFIEFSETLQGINTGSSEIYNLFNQSCSIYKTRTGIFEDIFKPINTPLQNKKVKIGWVGRIDTETHRSHKGIDLVYEALKSLDVELELRTFNEKKVTRNEMVQFYQSLDMFICSSISEQHPMPVLEAAACGVPIIATNVGIVPELIQHGENGLIVDRNSEAIKKAVLILLNNKKTCEKFRENIRETIVNKWTWELCKKDWELFFKNN